MGNALRLLFNLHPGEGRKACLFIILGLLWSVGSYGSFVLSEGMFLERVGAHALPKIYFAIAGAMCLLSCILIFALNRCSIRSLLFSIITLWILTNLTFFLLFPFYNNTKTFWYVYKAVGWIIPISTYIVYWAFADQYYDLQDGKRFFCLFNSVTFLGDALGSGLIVHFLDLIGIRGLLLLFVGAMLASLPFILIITRRHAPLLEEHNESVDSTSSVDLKVILTTIFKSKFTLYLVLFYFSMQLLAVVTEFNYMDSYEHAFAEAPANALTEFNGRVGMWISLGNMVFGMFIYSRLVKKMGVNNIILIAPSFFFAIFSFWFFKDALAIAIFGMIAREGMVYSFDDNNLNLLITGVPTKIKNQVRIAVESFIEPSGMFAAAVLLLAFQNQAHVLGLFISICAVVIVCFLRTTYPRAIFRNLVASSIRFDKKIRDYLGQFSKKELKRTEFLLLSNLKLSSEKKQLIAFEYLLKIGNLRVLPRLLNHIGKLSLPGKLKAIELLSESLWSTESVVLERLERWRSIFPHPAVKSAIYFYLARHGVLRPERIMNDLHSDHLGLKAAAILTLKTSAHAFHFPSFCSLASEKLRQLLESKHEHEVCIALEILGLEKKTSNIEIIFFYLKHPSLSVNRAAAKALSLIPISHTFLENSLTLPPEDESQETERRCFSKKCEKSGLNSHSGGQYANQIIDRLPYIQDSTLRLYYLQALEKLADTDSVRPLILSALHFRPAERKYVERIVWSLNQHHLPVSSKNGEKSGIAEVLVELVQDRRAADRSRLLAGKILGKIDRKVLQKQLFAVVKADIERAYFYFYHAHTIQKQVPEHDLSILQKALMTGYHSIIDFIIQLLGIAGSLEECEVLSHTLRSQNRKIRAQAIESLEKTCNTRLFVLLEPLIDDRHSDEKLRHYLKTGGIPLNLTQLLDAMAHSSSRADQIISLVMKAQLKTPDWRFTLREKLESKEEIFHHFALELLEGHA